MENLCTKCKRHAHPTQKCDVCGDPLHITCGYMKFVDGKNNEAIFGHKDCLKFMLNAPTKKYKESTIIYKENDDNLNNVPDKYHKEYFVLESAHLGSVDMKPVLICKNTNNQKFYIEEFESHAFMTDYILITTKFADYVAPSINGVR